MPAFSVGLKSEELDEKQTTLQISREAGSNSIKGGCFTAQIDLITGLAPAESLQDDFDLKDAIIIDQPFIFALNDQELEIN